MRKFMRLVKIDEEKRIVIGRATEEVADKSDEILDYQSSKPNFQKWSSEIEKASKGKSKGNIREMHGNKVAGVIKQMMFNDDEKAIDIEVYVIADDAWKMVKEGGYTGFSIGGSYVRKWADPDNSDLIRFTARVVEVSLVDNPCVPTATFEAIKADGTTEMRKFKSVKEAQTLMAKQVWMTSDGKTFDKKTDAEKHGVILDAAANLDPEAKKAIDAINAVLKADNKDEDEDQDKDKEEEDEDQDKLTDKEQEEADKAAAKKKKEEDETPEEKEEREAEEKEMADKKTKKAKAVSGIKKALSEAMDAAQATHILCMLEDLLAGEEGEDGQEDDIEAAIERLKAFIAAEVMEGTEKMVKTGARHSKADMDNLKKMSDTLHGMHEHMTSAMDKCMDMHKCMKGMGMPGHDMGDETEESQKMAKLSADFAKLAATNETLTQFIKGVVPEIQGLRDDLNTPVVRKSRLANASEAGKTLNKGNHEPDQAVEVLPPRTVRYTPSSANN